MRSVRVVKENLYRDNEESVQWNVTALLLVIDAGRPTVYNLSTFFLGDSLKNCFRRGKKRAVIIFISKL
jgi:hypothetical protein